jgi:tetratricopeptide (TPR) repeat protein
MPAYRLHGLVFLLLAAVLFACNGNQAGPSKETIAALRLKRGEVISCGSPGNEFGQVNFRITGEEKAQKDFNLALGLLHSFEYDEAEKVFAKIIDESPGTAMAYWGIAMCSFHPLWEAPNDADLTKGAKAIEIANAITGKSTQEADYINALAAYYNNWKANNPRARSIHFENAMAKLHAKYPADMEASIFYALALDAAADPTDRLYSKQKQAGEILQALYKQQPDHPGIIHYIIHTYDYPGMANLALPAAKKYAAIAPSSAHALHMPSHIFTRLGLWDDCIATNRKSIEAAKCYAETAGFKGHWDEELHGLDYLVYAYLQKGDNAAAGEQLQYIRSINQVFPINFKEAYTFAAAPSRMALENKNWQQAAALTLHPADFPWKKFPWQESIIHFARLLGAVHTNNLSAAEVELQTLQQLNNTLQQQKELYKGSQVAIQVKTGEAWIAWMKGSNAEALSLMRIAANMEDSTSKHPVTPGEVLPASELHADMLLQLKQYEAALQAYEKVLQKSPNRFNSLYGAAVVAQKLNLKNKALGYYKQLVGIANPSSNRPEVSMARAFINKS